MNHLEAFAKGVAAAVGGGIIYWLGGLDQLLAALLAVIVIDYGTGIVSAIHNRCLSSRIGFSGIAKKVMLLGIVALSYVIQRFVGDAVPLREVTISFFVLNEALSILENASEMGVPIPKKLQSYLKQISDGEEKADE